MKLTTMSQQRNSSLLKECLTDKQNKIHNIGKDKVS